MSKLKFTLTTEELKGIDETNGFDALMEEKNRRLEIVLQIFKEDPNTPLKRACEEVGCSLRSMNRYIAELRSQGKIVSTYSETEAREKGIQALRKLLVEHPEYTVSQRCKKLGVVVRTYRSYMAEIHRRYS